MSDDRLLAALTRLGHEELPSATDRQIKARLETAWTSRARAVAAPLFSVRRFAPVLAAFVVVAGLGGAALGAGADSPLWDTPAADRDVDAGACAERVGIGVADGGKLTVSISFADSLGLPGGSTAADGDAAADAHSHADDDCASDGAADAQAKPDADARADDDHRDRARREWRERDGRLHRDGADVPDVDHPVLGQGDERRLRVLGHVQPGPDDHALRLLDQLDRRALQRELDDHDRQSHDAHAADDPHPSEVVLAAYEEGPARSRCLGKRSTTRRRDGAKPCGDT